MRHSPSWAGSAASTSARCSSATGGWRVCCAARAPSWPVRRSTPTSTPTIPSRCSSRTSTARSARRCSATGPPWPGTRRRPRRCCRPPRVSIRSRCSTCCALWLSPRRSARATATTGASCWPRWTRRRGGSPPAPRTRRRTSCTCCGWSRPSGPGRSATSGRRPSPSTQRRTWCGRRRWHRALIAERAARFSLAHGLDHAGTELLAEARREYATWGATAKVAQLDRAYPSLRAHVGTLTEHGDGHHGDAPVTTGMIDLLGVLSASQALSSETSVERLHARVVEVLSAMTGATDVHLLL